MVLWALVFRHQDKFCRQSLGVLLRVLALAPAVRGALHFADVEPRLIPSGAVMPEFQDLGKFAA